MNNFTLYNPVRLVFGKDQIAALPKELPQGSRILMTYGGGSIKRNGVYDQVMKALEGYEVVEFGGIEANPQYQTLLKALALIKEQQLDYILAVGGGSVIDGTKFLASAAKYEGGEPWDILAKRMRTEEGNALPFGTVLTLPATGSEMNSGSVISRAETGEKRTMGGPGLFPQFSICDPTVCHSLPQRQIANGVADAYTHVLEQYLTYVHDATLQDRISESVLQSLIEVAPKVLANPADYTAAANFMWCCTMALNGLIQKGVPSDWSTHMIGHELTAAYGIDHARTLAIILPSNYTYRFEQKKEKLAQYGERVWGLTEGSVEERAKAAIAKTEEFYQSLGIATRLSDYTNDYEGFGGRVAKALEGAGMLTLGEHRDVTPADAQKIVEMAY